MLNPKAKLARNLFDRKKIKRIPTRNGYGEGMVEAGKKDKNVVVLCADLTESTRSNYFQEKFPDRFVQMGIAEQNMMGMAAGMAFSGKIPFISTYGVFCPGRNWDQLRVSVCYSKANVKLTGAHTGISVGPDGATHQALEDIAITRCLPNLKVIVPGDYEETKKATMEAAKIKGPVYIRFAREATPVFTTKNSPFKVGQANVLKEGSDVSIIACGPLVYEALQAAKKLFAQKIDVEVINNHTIKPIDEKTIIASAKKTKAVVTVEEHQIMGGAGSAVMEVLGKYYPVPVEMVGINDTFGASGEPEELLKKYGCTEKDIVDAVKKVIKRK